jgi:hypothetical protein
MVLRNLLLTVIRISAVDKTRKRSFLNDRWVQRKAFGVPTPAVALRKGSDNSNELRVTPLPIRHLLLSEWVKKTRDYPEICQKYGFTLDHILPSSTQPTNDMIFPTFPERPKGLNEEEINLEAVKKEAEEAEVYFMKRVEAEIRKHTNPVPLIKHAQLLMIKVFKDAYTTEELLSIIPVAT